MVLSAIVVVAIVELGVAPNRGSVSNRTPVNESKFTRNNINLIFTAFLYLEATMLIRNVQFYRNNIRNLAYPKKVAHIVFG